MLYHQCRRRGRLMAGGELAWRREAPLEALARPDERWRIIWPKRLKPTSNQPSNSKRVINHLAKGLRQQAAT